MHQNPAGLQACDTSHLTESRACAPVSSSPAYMHASSNKELWFLPAILDIVQLIAGSTCHLIFLSNPLHKTHTCYRLCTLAAHHCKHAASTPEQCYQTSKYGSRSFRPWTFALCLCCQVHAVKRVPKASLCKLSGICMGTVQAYPAKLQVGWLSKAASNEFGDKQAGRAHLWDHQIVFNAVSCTQVPLQ